MTPFKVTTIRHEPECKQGTDSVVLTAEDGREIVLQLDGDCCSQSYFEEQSLADLKSLVGETVAKFEHVAQRIVDGDENSVVVQYHALKITTDKSELVLDWRNESNGYYDGWCDVVGWEPKLNRGY